MPEDFMPDPMFDMPDPVFDDEAAASESAAAEYQSRMMSAEEQIRQLQNDRLDNLLMKKEEPLMPEATKLPESKGTLPKRPDVKTIDPCTIDYHKADPSNQANEELTIEYLDAKGQGGAHHRYRISWQVLPSYRHSITFDFQNGPIQEYGVNGITQEALLAIVIHRLECFQEGPFANMHNAAALDYCTMALDALKDRTRDRLARGVEGRNEL